MNIGEFESILRAIDYKPGWRFTFAPARRGDRYVITVQMAQIPADDNTADGMIDAVLERVHAATAEVTLNLSRYFAQFFVSPELVDVCRTEKDVIEVVRNHLLTMENHELDEWFKFEGERVNEPHLIARRSL